MLTIDTVAGVIDAAADIVQFEGWCKGMSRMDRNGNLAFDDRDAIAWCAVGAIDRAARARNLYLVPSLAFLYNIIGLPAHCLSQVNDQARNGAEVADHLRGLAKDLRAKESPQA